MRSSHMSRAVRLGRLDTTITLAIAVAISSVLSSVPLHAENPPLPVRDAFRNARGELEIARLRAMEKFDRSPSGKALAEQVQTWEAKLAEAIANQPEHEQIAAAAGLQNARTAQDAGREAAINSDPAVRQAEVKMMSRDATRGSTPGE